MRSFQVFVERSLCHLYARGCISIRLPFKVICAYNKIRAIQFNLLAPPFQISNKEVVGPALFHAVSVVPIPFSCEFSHCEIERYDMADGTAVGYIVGSYFHFFAPRRSAQVFNN
jgi:hypothetical protein